MLIIPELKDVVLKYLVDNYEVEEYVTFGWDHKIENVGGNTLHAILGQFTERGLITRNQMENGYFFKVKIDAHDFIQRGGFYGYETIFRNSVEKLLHEAEKMQEENPTPKNSQRIQDIANIVQSIAAYYQMVST